MMACTLSTGSYVLALYQRSLPYHNAPTIWTPQRRRMFIDFLSINSQHAVAAGPPPRKTSLTAPLQYTFVLNNYIHKLSSGDTFHEMKPKKA